jgi:hypothetical protein
VRVIRLSLVGLAAITLLGCAQTTHEPPALNIADRPFPKSQPTTQWCQAAEEAKSEPKISPDLRQQYINAATNNGCYGPPPPKPQPVYQKAGATNEEFQRTKARCLLESGMGGADFNPLALRLCMRAEGWVLVPQQ